MIYLDGEEAPFRHRSLVQKLKPGLLIVRLLDFVGLVPMDSERRRLFGLVAAAGALSASSAAAAPAPPISALGVDATQFGGRPGSPDDQTAVLQRAIDQTARAGAPLVLP